MAVTIAHPAVAVPLRRVGLLLSPLVIGSIIPDFEFFLRMSLNRSISHTIPGIFLFCLPVGLAVLIVYHTILKRPILSLLPLGHQIRLAAAAESFRFFPLGRFLRILLSLLAGILTHLAWDSFTHSDGWVVRMIPALSLPVMSLGEHSMRVHYLLQYATSALGLAFLIWSYARWVSRAPARAPAPVRMMALRRRIMCSLFIGGYGFAGGLAFGASSIPHIRGLKTLEMFIAHTAVGTVSSVLLVAFAFAVLWHWADRCLPPVRTGDAG